MRKDLFILGSQVSAIGSQVQVFSIRFGYRAFYAFALHLPPLSTGQLVN